VIAAEFLPAARTELLDAVDWYTQRSPDAALRFVEAVGQAVHLIEERCEAWPAWTGAPGIRVKTVARFPYSLPYVIEPQRLLVLAVAHASRQHGYWMARAPRAR